VNARNYRAGREIRADIFENALRLGAAGKAAIRRLHSPNERHEREFEKGFILRRFSVFRVCVRAKNPIREQITAFVTKTLRASSRQPATQLFGADYLLA